MMTAKIVPITGDARARAMADSTRLMPENEFAAMSPDCEIRSGRLLGIFPKSHIASRQASTTP